ncbi:E3 ubiquitin-protein ligase KCMF1-like isoform X1 [Dinothrombium tinctorium]|uniref:E3 ubiquitin-protein ligase KCMF1 n=1 Tax=Dinothrombium tinctorium TaxID=1965070 RepID=A0A3S3SDS1_9ACAR|nr:E3 ubiquitin-protein ligase KCMF1-like isoform X1 [Dinothrombium tinctorium]RWS13939.1 E3 ubiquitin-protein ligase KCMF1-like isoform X1 [Dinothrombium tinctorium]
MSSHHEGVSCDSCEKNNFRGKRYKCLVCFDYDLCSTCYESGATSSRHTNEHPMQCILTRSDCELFFGGEAITSEAPQSFTCPFCGKMGFTENSLQEHVTAEHGDASSEVVCPICASLPGGEPNHVTDDFATHLTLEHRNPQPQSSGRGRRVPHPSRGMNSARARRTQMHFNTSSGLSSLSPGHRESMDPIAELLSQLSGVRRAANLGQSHSSQLQQLQMQLQFERQSSTSSRQSFERAPIERVTRRNQQTPQSQSHQQSNATQPAVNGGQIGHEVLMEPSPSPSTLVAAASAVANANVPSLNYVSSNATNCQFLLSTCNESNLSENEQQAVEIHRADRSLLVQELLLQTLSDRSIEALNHSEHDGDEEEAIDLCAKENDFYLGYEVKSEGDEEVDEIQNETDLVTGVNHLTTSKNLNENERPKQLKSMQASNLDPNLNPHVVNHKQVLRNSTQQQQQQGRQSRGRASNANTRANNVNSIDNSNNRSVQQHVTQHDSTSPPSSSQRRKVLRQPNESSQH